MESLPRAYKSQFMGIAGQFDKAAEGDRCLIRDVEVVENARKLGNDLMRIVVDGLLHVEYPKIHIFKAVDFDTDLLQL